LQRWLSPIAFAFFVITHYKLLGFLQQGAAQGQVNQMAAFSRETQLLSDESESWFDVPKLSRSTLNEEVYEQLKQALMSGKIAPGSTMTIRSLASSFGISVMPVREALRRLVAEHVLTLLPNRSVSLPVFTRERFNEITRIRTSLEGLAAEEGARHLTPEMLAHMVRMTSLMESKAAGSNAETLAWNREFHFTLYTASNMPTLVKMIESLWLQAGPLLHLQQRVFAAKKQPVYVHHHRALQAIKASKPALVRDAIVGDIEDAAEIISAAL
jgi:DNA-binding GntR family transcriptional regulator